MDESFILKYKKPIIISIIIIIIFIIVFSVVQFILNSREQKVIINNFADCVKDINDTDSENVAKKLYSYINNQNKLNNTQISSYYNGEIRANSCETEDSNYDDIIVSHANFILDIPDLEYSYRVKFNWIKSENKTDKWVDLGTTEIYCLADKETIYPDFNCDQNPSVSVEIDPIYQVNLNYSKDCWVSYAYSDDAPSHIKLQITYYPTDEDYQKGTVKQVKDTCVSTIENILTTNKIDLNNYEIIPKLQMFRY